MLASEQARDPLVEPAWQGCPVSGAAHKDMNQLMSQRPLSILHTALAGHADDDSTLVRGSSPSGPGRQMPRRLKRGGLAHRCHHRDGDGTTVGIADALSELGHPRVGTVGELVGHVFGHGFTFDVNDGDAD
jgi:hypothetical protein